MWAMATFYTLKGFWLIGGKHFSNLRGCSLKICTFCCLEILHEELNKYGTLRNSQVVQWLGPGTFIAITQVQSLVGELRCYRPCGVAKNQKTNMEL